MQYMRMRMRQFKRKLIGKTNTPGTYSKIRYKGGGVQVQYFFEGGVVNWLYRLHICIFSRFSLYLPFPPIFLHLPRKFLERMGGHLHPLAAHCNTYVKILIEHVHMMIRARRKNLNTKLNYYLIKSKAKKHLFIYSITRLDKDVF